MKRKTRGRAIIINNMKFEFDKMPYRHGSDKDAERLETVLKQLHFTVEVKPNQTSQVIVGLIFIISLHYVCNDR